MEKEEYLYRYTSLDNLALILKNHTIRLNPLDIMDDRQEQRSEDINNIGKFVFISSWTEEETEHIPMWKMYTDMRAGVRIRLPKNPFKRTKTSLGSLSRIPNLSVSPDSARGALDTFLDLGDLMRRGAMSLQAWSGDILVPIQYTDDITLLEPRFRNITNDKLNLQIQKIGLYKNTYWKFQREWRYRMIFMNFDITHGIENSFQQFNISVNRMAYGNEPPPFRFFDLEIDQTCFENMEITPSPQISLGNRVLLDTLVERYNPTAVIKESELRNLI